MRSSIFSYMSFEKICLNALSLSLKTLPLSVAVAVDPTYVSLGSMCEGRHALLANGVRRYPTRYTTLHLHLPLLVHLVLAELPTSEVDHTRTP